VAAIDEMAIREAALRFVEDRTEFGTRTVTQPEVASFPFLGREVPLLLRQQGICKPRRLDAALAIRTTWTPPGRQPPYVDEEGPDGLIRYAYRGDDPDHWDNVALRRAGQYGLPLVWFVAVSPGVYHAQYPVYVVADEPEHLRVALAVDEAQRWLPSPVAEPDRRRYVERLNKLRLHQPGVPGASAFRLRRCPCNVPPTARRPARRGAHPCGHSSPRNGCGPQRARTVQHPPPGIRPERVRHSAGSRD
jgi:putative restriction endonuclease